MPPPNIDQRVTKLKNKRLELQVQVVELKRDLERSNRVIAERNVEIRRLKNKLRGPKKKGLLSL